MTCGADGVQIHLQQRSACGDLLILLDQSGKALTLHVHGVHADVDQQLDAVVAGDADSVQGGGDLGHSTVKGGVHGVAGGLDAAAGAQNALCKGLIRDVGLCQHLALQRGQHGLALVGELSGVFVLGLAAKKLVKKTHKYHSFLSSCKGGKGNKMFADPEVFTCIKRYHIAHQNARKAWTFSPCDQGRGGCFLPGRGTAKKTPAEAGVFSGSRGLPRKRHFPAGLPSPPLERFRVGWCFSMDCCSCSRRVREVERPSATMYSRVLPQP